MPPDQPEWVLRERRLVGERVRSARIRAGLSQETLGERVDLDRRTIHRIEYAVSDVRLGTLLRIARALRMPVTDLFT